MLHASKSIKGLMDAKSTLHLILYGIMHMKRQWMSRPHWWTQTCLCTKNTPTESQPCSKMHFVRCKKWTIDRPLLALNVHAKTLILSQYDVLDFSIFLPQTERWDELNTCTSIEAQVVHGIVCERAKTADFLKRRTHCAIEICYVEGKNLLNLQRWGRGNWAKRGVLLECRMWETKKPSYDQLFIRMVNFTYIGFRIPMKLGHVHRDAYFVLKTTKFRANNWIVSKWKMKVEIRKLSQWQVCPIAAPQRCCKSRGSTAEVYKCQISNFDIALSVWMKIRVNDRRIQAPVQGKLKIEPLIPTFELWDKFSRWITIWLEISEDESKVLIPLTTQLRQPEIDMIRL